MTPLDLRGKTADNFACPLCHKELMGIGDNLYCMSEAHKVNVKIEFSNNKLSNLEFKIEEFKLRFYYQALSLYDMLIRMTSDGFRWVDAPQSLAHSTIKDYSISDFKTWMVFS